MRDILSAALMSIGSVSLAIPSMYDTCLTPLIVFQFALNVRYNIYIGFYFMQGFLSLAGYFTRNPRCSHAVGMRKRFVYLRTMFLTALGL